MITAQVEAKNTTKMKLWKCLRQMEQSQNTARNVKKVLGKNTAHSGLSQVMAPTSQTDPTQQNLTTKIELENACLEEPNAGLHRWPTLPCSNHP